MAEVSCKVTEVCIRINIRLVLSFSLSLSLLRVIVREWMNE